MVCHCPNLALEISEQATWPGNCREGPRSLGNGFHGEGSVLTVLDLSHPLLPCRHDFHLLPPLNCGLLLLLVVPVGCPGEPSSPNYTGKSHRVPLVTASRHTARVQPLDDPSDDLAFACFLALIFSGMLGKGVWLPHHPRLAFWSHYLSQMLTHSLLHPSHPLTQV